MIPLAWAFAGPASESSKLLPEKIGNFRGRIATDAPALGPPELFAPDNFAVVSQVSRLYSAGEGDSFSVRAFDTRSYSAAYSMLTTYGWGKLEIKRNLVGTAAILEEGRVTFFKGTTFIQITAKGSQDSLLSFARTLAEQIDAGDNDIPVLVKHLPEWESVQPRAFYATTPNALKQSTPDQPILNDINFEGGTEAAAAYYGTTKMLLVEFGTPQIAADNDQRLTAKLQELQSQGQRVPTRYRRVGNYSVFVFDAPVLKLPIS